MDGLRGLAILLVIGFHAFCSWLEVLPYGNQYASFPLFSAGWLGVQLFFPHFRLCHSHEPGAFFRHTPVPEKKVAAPLPCHGTGHWGLSLSQPPLLPERPAGTPSLTDALPGLTFTEPGWWNALLGTQLDSLEAPFWSLYVEFKFYVIAALLYFALGRNRLIFSLLALFITALALKIILKTVDIGALQTADQIFDALSIRQFGWFCGRLCLLCLYQNRRQKLVLRRPGHRHPQHPDRQGGILPCPQLWGRL